MRKLLLLTNCFVICALLSSCQTPTINKNEREVETSKTAVTKDSLTNNKVVIQTDTTKTIK
ncbi:MAG: hypothetical protein IPK10_19960 [Bacteroidetes bacterium]|nr:hypothetical protein [Bacteroidota bacterium]